MKILLLITKAEIGGAQNMVQTLAKGMKKQGHEVVLGFGKNSGNFLKEAAQKENISTKEFTYLQRSLNPLVQLKFEREIMAYLQQKKFDVIHLNSSNTLPAAKVAKKHFPHLKTVFTFRGLSYLDPGSRKPIMRFIFLSYFKKYLPFVDVPVFVSQTNKLYANEKGICDSHHVVYNAPKVTFFEKEEARVAMAKLLNKEENYFENKKIIGSVGRLAYPKNYEFVISTLPTILKEQPNTVFIVFGSGPEKEKYTKLIHELELEKSVYIIEGINDAAKYIKGFDIFTLPSLYEGLSITLVEALKAEIPIVASNVGGSHEVVADDPNQLFESQNSIDFTQKVLSFFSKNQLYTQTVQLNKTQLDQFSSQKMVEQYLGLYG